MNKMVSDYWKVYEKIMSKEKRIQSKSETFTVESYYNLFRHFLVRMRHKSKCYSKSKYELELSILLLIPKRNNQLPILI